MSHTPSTNLETAQPVTSNQTFHKLLGDLNGVGRCSFAEIIADAPEVD